MKVVDNVLATGEILTNNIRNYIHYQYYNDLFGTNVKT